jgi:hypothetical protein
MEKQQILNKINDLTAEQLFGFIYQRIVTLDDLKATGDLDSSKRKEIIALQSKREKADNDAWIAVRYGNETALADFICNNPNNKHVPEAKNRIDELREQRAKAQAEKQHILAKIRRNPNTYSPHEIKAFIIKGTFTEHDLQNCDIPQSAINNLYKIKTPTLNLGATPASIPEGYTEVYFWGYNGSGKTCALGAILQMADKEGFLNIAAGPGHIYAKQLKGIFSDDGAANDFLPAPSPVETTQYLPFTLKKPNESKSRSVSLIELSGEIFRCFLLKISGAPMPTESHENTFNSLNTFLKSNNRKIHFFFIDYDRENKPDDQGLTQSDYLDAASTYFKNNAVFGKTTDAIYIVLTKSDLILDDNDHPVPNHKRIDYAREHLRTNYLSFVNTLKDNCKKYSINGGRLTVEPFSLGKVYFKQICDFEGSAASNIVKILMERIPGTKKSILDVLNK